MAYETEQELNTALWEKINRRKRTTISVPPYDDADVDAILGDKMRRKRQLNPNKENNHHFQHPSIFCANNYKFAPFVRTALGITNPISIEDLPSTLAKFESKEKIHPTEKDVEYLKKWGVEIGSNLHDTEWADGDLLFKYPMPQYTLSPQRDEWLKYGSEGFPTYRIKQVNLNSKVDRAVISFKWLLDMQSSDYGIHPALILAFYLSDMDIHDKITLIIENQISLWLPSFPVSDNEIRLANCQMRELSKIPSTKKLGLSIRVIALHQFRKEHSKLNWKQLFQEWNKTHPKWQYKNPASMHVVFSRASKKIHNKLEPWAENWCDDMISRFDEYREWVDSPFHDSPSYHRGWKAIPEDVKTRLVGGKGTKQDFDILCEEDYRAEHPGWDLIPKRTRKAIIKEVYDYSDVLDEADEKAKATATNKIINK